MEEHKINSHQLAIAYFEGRITLPEEEILFGFVSATSGNYKLFRQWEKEWMLSGAPDMKVAGEWIHLQRRMQVKSALSGLFNPTRYNLQRIASIAAIIVVVILSGTYSLFSYFDAEQKETYFTLETAYGEKSKIVLTDGTIVWLNAGSTLRYADNFNSKNREVLLEGEAYFEVKKQINETPFLVKTNLYNVQVKGTKFNVTSYAEDLISSVTLLEGAIDVRYQDKSIPVHPGESLCIDKEKGAFEFHNVQAAQYKSWIEGRVEYDEITLHELAVRLSRKYDVRIKIDDALDKNATFRVSLRNEETINQVLQALSEILPIRFEKHEREIYIRKQ